MAKIPLSRNTRFVEALAFLSLLSRGLASATGEHSPSPLTFLLLLGLTLSLMLGGLVSPLVRKASWVALLVCGLVSVALQPFETGLLWILAAAFAMFHDGWFTRHPLVVTLVTGAAVAGAQALALLLHPSDFLPLAAGILLADLALAFLTFTFRHDLLGAGTEHRPVLRLADYGLSDRELQVIHLVWGGRVSKEIAHELGLGEASVRKHLSSIYQKLGVVGARELFVLSHSHRIVIDESKS